MPIGRKNEIFKFFLVPFVIFEDTKTQFINVRMFRKFLTERWELERIQNQKGAGRSRVYWIHGTDYLELCEECYQKGLCSGISLETLSERNYIEYLTSEDKHECEDCYGILNFQIPINSELVNILLDGLTERERQALILRVVLDLDYDEIGKKLGIEPNRVRDYKYQGLRKARKKKNGGKK